MISGAQLEMSFFFTQRYKQMSPEQAIREQPDNFAIEKSQIRKVRVWRKNESGKQLLKRVFWEVEFESSRGKEMYVIDDADPEQELNAAFASKM